MFHSMPKTNHPSMKHNDTQRGHLQQKESPSIEFVQLKGHSGSVLCLDHSNGANRIHDSTLLSGSEDGTCRLWDLRTGLRASLCITCNANHEVGTATATAPGTAVNTRCDVLSVSFGPPWHHQQQQPIVTDQANVGASSFARDYSVYAAVGHTVYGYDLRHTTSPIISFPSSDYSFLECTDEINQIAFSPATTKVQSQRGSVLLATADDSGMVRVTDSKQRRIYTHDSTALVTSIAYRPQRQQQQLYSGNGKNKKQPSVILASGGTDCSIRLWEVGDTCRYSNDVNATTTDSQSQTVPLTTISIPQTSSSESNQVCNPPMVHCLQWSPSGQSLVAGLGDGSVAIMHHTKTRNAPLVLSTRIDDAHSGPVASCLFPAWTNKHCGSNAIVANDRLMCTTGNDGSIAFWDLGETIGGEKANNPADLFELSNDKSSNDDILDVPQTLFAFQHHVGKPNWMIHSGSNEISFPYSLFVADTTNNITVYTIPIR